jgi:hypothetical protein
MKNNAINTLNYTGIVTLSRYVGSKKIEIAKLHNSGGYSLFNFFSDCLVGNFDIAKINRPTKIMLLAKDADGNFAQASDFIVQVSNPEKIYKATSSAVKLSFMIPQDKFSSTTFTHIGLYANSTSYDDCDQYAALVAKPTSLTNLSASSALLIDWELNISNSATPKGD